MPYTRYEGSLEGVGKYSLICCHLSLLYLLLNQNIVLITKSKCILPVKLFQSCTRSAFGLYKNILMLGLKCFNSHITLMSGYHLVLLMHILEIKKS